MGRKYPFGGICRQQKIEIVSIYHSVGKLQLFNPFLTILTDNITGYCTHSICMSEAPVSINPYTETRTRVSVNETLGFRPGFRQLC